MVNDSIVNNMNINVLKIKEVLNFLKKWNYLFNVNCILKNVNYLIYLYIM